MRVIVIFFVLLTAGSSLPLFSSTNQINDDTLDRTRLLTGDFDVRLHSDFATLPERVSYRKTYLRKETLQAFLKMEQEARKAGVLLKVVSGFRSYQHQKNIWDNKFKAYGPAHPNIEERVEQILNYTAIPGISRHHWGTDLDINALNNEYFLNKNSIGNNVHTWLVENAEKYGFYLTYTFNRTGGYHPEMWHYTYYPSSSKMMKEFYLYMTPQTLPSFQGGNSIDLDKIFYEYSFNINPIIIDKLRIDDISIILTY